MMDPIAAIGLLRAHCRQVETPEYIVEAFEVVYQHISKLEGALAVIEQARDAVANRPANAVLDVNKAEADDKAHAVFIARSRP